MNDEENKAIDYLKNDVVYWLDKGKDFVVIDIGENDKLHSILNLIEKLIKEIEKIKDKNKTLEGLLQGNLFELYLYYKELASKYQANSISKDKIREKIKEIESYAFTSEEEKNQQDYAIERIKELLEED